MTVTIKFSHHYAKMPRQFLENTYLVGVSVCDIERLPEQFLAWDTFYHGTAEENFKASHYPLPRTGRFMVLSLFSWCPELTLDASPFPIARTWTTIRSWEQAKEDYYRALVGQRVKIEIEAKTEPLIVEEYAASVKRMETLDGWKKCPSCGNAQWRVNFCSQCGHAARDLGTVAKQATL